MKKRKNPPQRPSMLEGLMAQAFAEAEAAGMLKGITGRAEHADPIAQAQAEAMERASFSTRHLWEYRGYGIAISADKPRYQLPDDAASFLPPEAIAETAAWAREACGSTNPLADGQVVVLEKNRTFIMNPRTLATVRAAAERAGEPFECLHADGWPLHPKLGKPWTWCPHCGAEVPF